MDEPAHGAVQPALPTPTDAADPGTAAATEAVAPVNAANDAPPAALTKVTLAVAGPTVTKALGDVVGVPGPTGPASSSVH